eukprot:m.90018 g.90018  ORF g.90018 m.90018 type:complete len:351 (-) comp16452_c0_seq6:399-1451(-)
MSLKVAETTWRGVHDFCQAWRISNGTVRLTVMKLGGHIAAISDDHDDNALNPLWQPHWEPKDPSKIPYDGTAGLKRGWVMSKKFGGTSEAALLAGIVGHNLCIDRFGPPHTMLVQQGKLMKERQEWRPTHGEAGVLPWTMTDQSSEHITLSVKLPEAALKICRTFTMENNAIQLKTVVKPTNATGKTIDWCEHVTIGDPFLDGAQISSDCSAAWTFPEAQEAPRFPTAAPLEEVPVAEAFAVPHPSDPPCGDVITTKVNDGWFTVANKGRTLKYSWDKNTFPWLCLWTEHKSRTDLPWEGVERTRGLEFSTKPFPEAKPPPERAEEFHGTPTTCDIGSDGRTEVMEITWT